VPGLVDLINQAATDVQLDPVRPDSIFLAGRKQLPRSLSIEVGVSDGTFTPSEIHPPGGGTAMDIIAVGITYQVVGEEALYRSILRYAAAVQQALLEPAHGFGPNSQATSVRQVYAFVDPDGGTPREVRAKGILLFTVEHDEAPAG
jgi:hypothetical protein